MAHSRQHWLPVRCCCRPEKVFGFLRLPEDALRAQEVTLPDRNGAPQRVSLRRFAERPEIKTMFDPDAIGVFSMPTWEIAVYSDDQPPEFWQRFEHFVPAVADE